MKNLHEIYNPAMVSDYSLKILICHNLFSMIKKFAIVSFLLLTCSANFAQDHKKALAAADSSEFSVNNKEGWKLYNSRLIPISADSIMIGLILQHDRSIDLTMEQMIGSIKSGKFFPEATRILQFNLITDTYQLRVGKNGKCFLRLVSGSLSSEADNLIIPFRVVFKK